MTEFVEPGVAERRMSPVGTASQLQTRVQSCLQSRNCSEDPLEAGPGHGKTLSYLVRCQLVSVLGANKVKVPCGRVNAVPASPTTAIALPYASINALRFSATTRNP